MVETEQKIWFDSISSEIHFIPKRNFPENLLSDAFREKDISEIFKTSGILSHTRGYKGKRREYVLVKISNNREIPRPMLSVIGLIHALSHVKGEKAENFLDEILNKLCSGELVCSYNSPESQNGVSCEKAEDEYDF